MRWVVDASVALKWYIPEEFEAEATRLRESDVELHAPELILPEFTNVVWHKIRRGELTDSEGRDILTAFLRSDISLHSHRQVMRSAFAGACLSGQTVYDWTYLSLAMALSCKMVTADKRFLVALESTSISKHLLWIGDLDRQ